MNNIEYIAKYNKEHYRQFKTILKKDEMDELEETLRKLKLNKAQFIREALKLMTKK